jgi:GNAT superfamily N-acetyltransferase
MSIVTSSDGGARWRPMLASDLAAIKRLADDIHPRYPERLVVFEEKLRLFPCGCFTLEAPDGDPAGYCFSHPWRRGVPPELNTLFGELPQPPTTFFVHDIAVAESHRRRGNAQALLSTLRTVAQRVRLDHMTLVAVSGSAPFWEKNGFHRTADVTVQRAVGAKYGAQAIHMEAALPPYL